MFDFKINNNKIGIGKPCFIVAELSANHAGSLKNLKNLF